MTHHKLLTAYQKLSPGLERVYVIPDIEKFSTHNSYLRLIYDPMIKENISKISVESSSFLTPKFIFRRALGEKSVLHHHWFEIRNLKMLLNSIWKICSISLYRLAGGKVVWTAHNIEPHFQGFRRLNLIFRRFWAKLPHKIHVHCQQAVAVMSPLLHVNEDKFFVAEHPVYPAKIIPKNNAREMLRNIIPERSNLSEKTVYLMFGYIAAYKGIREIVEIFRDLPLDRMLIIAGPVKKNETAYFQQLQKLKKGKPNIILLKKYIPNEEMSIVLSAVDYAIFNFSNILTSGSVVLAQCYKKKIIIPNIGCLQEMSGPNIFKFDTLPQLRQILSGFQHPEKP